MMQSTTSMEPVRVKSAERVLDIIDTLAAHRQGLTFTELQRHLSLPKSSLSALLGVLTQRGYAEYDERHRIYTLGVRLWERGQSYVRHHDLIEESRKVMEQIGARLNETVQFAILDGIENVYLAKVDSSHPLRLQSEVGGRLYAPATGVGKALLSELTPDELARRLPPTLPRFTANTLHDPPALARELSAIRARGFALDAQEYTPGLVCVAVPVYEHGHAVAAMSVSIPLMRLSLPLLANALSMLAEASLAITQRRGGAPDARLARLLAPDVAHALLAPLYARISQPLMVLPEPTL